MARADGSSKTLQATAQASLGMKEVSSLHSASREGAVVQSAKASERSAAAASHHSVAAASHKSAAAASHHSAAPSHHSAAKSAVASNRSQA